MQTLSLNILDLLTSVSFESEHQREIFNHLFHIVFSKWWYLTRRHIYLPSFFVHFKTILRKGKVESMKQKHRWQLHGSCRDKLSWTSVPLRCSLISNIYGTQTRLRRSVRLPFKLKNTWLFISAVRICTQQHNNSQLSPGVLAPSDSEQRDETDSALERSPTGLKIKQRCDNCFSRHSNACLAGWELKESSTHHSAGKSSVWKEGRAASNAGSHGWNQPVNTVNFSLFRD